MAERRQIIVLGMHRSGTSAVTGLLRAFGAHMGTDEELTSPNDENPLGFFERRDVREICDGLLMAAGADWWKVGDFRPAAISPATMESHTRRFCEIVAGLDFSGTWALKEPRLCLLLPVLARFLNDPVDVFVVRNPLESARSLRRRNGFPTQVGLALWEAYNVAALGNSAGLPRVFVNYHDLIADPARTGEAMCAQLSALGVVGLDPGKGAGAIDQSLHRQYAGSDEVLDLTTGVQEELWTALSSGRVERAPTAVSPVALMTLREFEADQAAREASELRKARALAAERAARDARARKLVAELKKRDAELEKRVAELEKRAAALKKLATRLSAREAEIGLLVFRLHSQKAEAGKQTDSITWRITAPLRRVFESTCWIAKSHDGFLTLFWWAITFQFHRLGLAQRSHQEETLIAGSGLFDPEWYLKTCPDVAKSDVDPLLHYCRWGAAEGRDPNPLFDSDWYLSKNPDLVGLNPLAHYLRVGAAEGRDPHPDFNTKSYLGRYRDVAAAGINPLEHYIRLGKAEGRSAMPTAAQATLRLEELLPREVLGSSFGRHLRIAVARNFPQRLADALLESGKILSEMSDRTTPGAGPLVSVVMPTYNRSNIIGEAIASVIEQDYPNWELLICDDASTDDTEQVAGSFNDLRIRYLKLSRAGAAAARNAGLREARGAIVAYLDTDNFWHPRFLGTMVLTLLEHPGRSAAYACFVDFHVNHQGDATVKSFERAPFDHERLLEKNFIDLNTLVHRRELYDCFGGFNENLTRRQDYDLLLKYSWLRDPVHVPCLLALYQRNDGLEQITRTQRHDDSCIGIIDRSVQGYFERGVPRVARSPARKVTVLSWDACRNHFAKAFAVAEALSTEHDVQLISYRFFEEEGIFAPLRHVKPSFETLYFPGAQFPEFFETMSQAVAAIRGEVIYAVKPRLPSLGLALLANQQRGIPVILEINDLETVVSSPKSNDRHREAAFETVDLAAGELLNPYSDLWSQLMDPLAKELPVPVTHNHRIDQHFGCRCLYMRNIKDERVYDPGRYDRERVRAELGFTPGDRVILFGGLVRKHKGIYELVELVERLKDPRYKLLFVGSRTTPDLQRLVQAHGNAIRVLPPQDHTAMARINLAADLVVLWLDPEVPASHYQMPYKATDALAMKTPIIANDISDLGELGRQGYLRIVPFGDWDRMIETIRDLFDSAGATDKLREAARRLYLRQFSYAAARGSFTLALQRALTVQPGVLPVAERFARRFAEFQQAVTRGGHADLNASPSAAGQASLDQPADARRG